MKPPNFKGKFQGTYLINPGLPWFILVKPWLAMALISGEVTLVCFYKNPSSIRLWEFIIAHVMKTMRPIFHPTALRQRRFDSPPYELTNESSR